MENKDLLNTYLFSEFYPKTLIREYYGIKTILKYQSRYGSYVASPNFRQYRYCWIRDGVFIAYAVDLVGYHESSRRFHEWVANVIDRLNSINKYLRDNEIVRVVNKITNFIKTKCIVNNHFAKFYNPQADEAAGLDASLLWLVHPFEIVEPEDPLFQNTVISIEKRLLELEGEYTDIQKILIMVEGNG